MSESINEHRNQYRGRNVALAVVAGSAAAALAACGSNPATKAVLPGPSRPPAPNTSTAPSTAAQLRPDLVPALAADGKNWALRIARLAADPALGVQPISPTAASNAQLIHTQQAKHAATLPSASLNFNEQASTANVAISSPEASVSVSLTFSLGENGSYLKSVERAAGSLAVSDFVQTIADPNTQLSFASVANLNKRNVDAFTITGDTLSASGAWTDSSTGKIVAGSETATGAAAYAIANTLIARLNEAGNQLGIS